MKKIEVYKVASLNQSSITANDNFETIIYLDTGNITENRINNLQLLDCSKDNIPSRAKRKVKDNTIVYSSVRPKLKHNGILVNPPKNMIVSTGFITIDADESVINPYYLYCCLTNRENTNYIIQIAETSVSSYPSINPDDIGNMKINLIEDKEIQNNIAKTLKSIDDIILLNNKINSEILGMVSNMFQFCILQKNDFGKEVSSKKIVELINLNNDKVNPNNHEDTFYAHYSIPAFDEKGSYIIEKGIDIKSEKHVVKENNILISKLNPWFSRVILPENIENAIASTEFVVLEPKNHNYYNFLYALAISEHFIKYCTIKASGTSNSHKRIDPEVMLSYKIPWDEKVVTNFSKKINPFIEKYKLNIKENRELNSMYHFLSPLLLNGKVGFKKSTIV